MKKKKTRKKVSRKPVKNKRKKSPQAAKPKKKKAASKKKNKKKKPSPVINAVPGGKLIGKVTHYFPHVNAAVIVLGKGSLRIGDTIVVKGHTTELKQQVTSMQIDHKPITDAKKGDEIGLFVSGRVREHDLVYTVAS